MLAILGFLTGLAGPIANLTGKLLEFKTAKLNADTDKEKAVIDQQIEETHARRDVILAQATNRVTGFFNALMAFLLAVGPLSYILKYFLWDKVIGAFAGCAGDSGSLIRCASFVTDGLNATMASVLVASISYYLLYTWKK